MDILEKITKFLETYNGRDKVLRTLSYTTKCASGLSNSQELSLRLDNFSSQVSACRATLRLLDDVPMIAYIFEYGLGKHESDAYVRIINLIGNIVDLLFYPADHIAWAIDHKIVSSKSTIFATASTVFWVISLYLTLAKSIRNMRLLTEHKFHITGDENEVREATKKILKQQKSAIIAALRSSADLIFAIHYLPEGYLWSGALKKWHVGALGSFSSILGLYQAFA